MSEKNQSQNTENLGELLKIRREKERQLCLTGLVNE